MRLKHQFAQIALAAAVLTFAAASPAAAAVNPGGLLIETGRNSPAPGSDTVIASATCSSGFSLVGLGASAPHLLKAVFPSLDFRTAAAQARVFGTGDLEVKALCLPSNQLGPTVPRTQSFASSGARFRRHTVRCPANMYAFRGAGRFTDSSGFTVERGDFMSTNAPTADGTGWTFGGVDTAVGDRVEVTALCATKTGRDRVAESRVPAAPRQTVPAVAECPAGWTAISGGVSVLNAGGLEIEGRTFSSIPTERNGIKGWAVSAQPIGANNTVVARAQCVV